MTGEIFWNCTGRNRGQMVEISEAQLAGAAEGKQGPARGLSLKYDRSSREWTVFCGSSPVGSGVGEPPDVEHAMRMAFAAK